VQAAEQAQQQQQPGLPHGTPQQQQQLLSPQVSASGAGAAAAAAAGASPGSSQSQQQRLGSQLGSPATPRSAASQQPGTPVLGAQSPCKWSNFVQAGQADARLGRPCARCSQAIRSHPPSSWST
jgi:hypothetical protein